MAESKHKAPRPPITILLLFQIFPILGDILNMLLSGHYGMEIGGKQL